MNPASSAALHDGVARRADQAQGLRRLFGARRPRHLALVANPHAGGAGAVLEQLAAALAALGRRTLVVDAADTSPAPHELAALDLAACIEPLTPQLSYLAARGLPLHHVDTRGSSAQLLQRLERAAPQADVLLVHAGAADVARLFGRAAPRALLLAADAPASLTDAYAGMKLLAQRCGLLACDLLLACAPGHPRAARIAERLAGCADRFLGAVLHDWVAVDPDADLRAPPSQALLRLLAALLQSDDELPEADDWPEASAAAWPAARPQPTPYPN